MESFKGSKEKLCKNTQLPVRASPPSSPYAILPPVRDCTEGLSNCIFGRWRIMGFSSQQCSALWTEANGMWALDGGWAGTFWKWSFPRVLSIKQTEGEGMKQRCRAGPGLWAQGRARLRKAERLRMWHLEGCGCRPWDQEGGNTLETFKRAHCWVPWWGPHLNFQLSISDQVMISGLWDGVLNPAPCSAGSLLFPLSLPAPSDK